MNDFAIRVDNLSKKYEIGVASRRYDSLRDQLVESVKGLLHRNSRASADQHTLWALKDVSFEVKEGEVIGIIGHNGSGKSTLLKILSRITKPTTGRAEIYGRVGSLLEVGTGFHPELTGRENIYLNGAILGMSKTEIERKFEEIVAFAEIEKFMDTPVKRYSSGMYVRLAFAVAAHLEPEILIVDEVLAVGDVGFQRKCLGKMHDVAGHGRTVLFVSHNMGAVKSLCNRCLLLGDGQILAEGPPEAVVAKYIAQYEEQRPERYCERIAADQKVWFDSGEGFFLLPKDKDREITIACGDILTVEFGIEAPKPLSEVTVSITVLTDMEDKVISMSSKVQNISSKQGHSRFWNVCCNMGRLPINAGTYFVSVWVGNGIRDVARFTKALTINVQEHDVFGWGNSLPKMKSWGPMYWAPQWEICPVNENK